MLQPGAVPSSDRTVEGSGAAFRKISGLESRAQGGLSGLGGLPTSSRRRPSGSGSIRNRSGQGSQSRARAVRKRGRAAITEGSERRRRVVSQDSEAESFVGRNVDQPGVAQRRAEGLHEHGGAL